MNGNDESGGLSSGLAALVEGPAPVSTVDAHEAVRQGRRRLLRRRAAVLGTTVVVAALAVGTVLSTGGQREGIGPAPAGELSPSPGRTVRPSPSASQFYATYSGHDPVNAEVSLGWLPPGLDWDVQYTLTGGGMTARATYPSDSRPGIVMVRLKPVGWQPARTGGTRPAPAVNGREAYWTVSDDPAVPDAPSVLVWQTADGRWAELDTGGLPEEQKESWEAQIAAGTTTGLRELPLPFRTGSLPEGLKLSAATFGRRPGSWEVELLLTGANGSHFATSVQPTGAMAGPSPGISGPVSRSSLPASALPSRSAGATPFPSRTAGAMPLPSRTAGATPFPSATGSFTPPTRVDTCRDDNGVTACVSALGDTSALDAVGGAFGWLQKLTLLGTDEHNWTTDVIG